MNQVQNLDGAVSILFYTLSLGKGMNPILSATMDK